MKRARILLADDYDLLLDAFRSLLEPGFEVIGTVTDGWEHLQKAQELRPDLILIDISMPLENRTGRWTKVKEDFNGGEVDLIDYESRLGFRHTGLADGSAWLRAQIFFGRRAL